VLNKYLYFNSTCERRGLRAHVLRSVCLFVCLSARISQKPGVQISPNFMHMLHVAVARFSSENNAMPYVLQFLSARRYTSAVLP